MIRRVRALSHVVVVVTLAGCSPSVPKYGPHGLSLYDDVKIDRAQLVLGSALSRANSLNPLFVHVNPDVSVSGLIVGHHFAFKSTLSNDGTIALDADLAGVVRCVDVKHPWFVRSLRQVRADWGEPASETSFEDGTTLTEYRFDHPEKKRNAEDYVSVVLKTSESGADLVEAISWLR